MVGVTTILGVGIVYGLLGFGEYLSDKLAQIEV
jgi:hypothetical protein